MPPALHRLRVLLCRVVQPERWVVSLPVVVRAARCRAARPVSRALQIRTENVDEHRPRFEYAIRK